MFHVVNKTKKTKIGQTNKETHEFKRDSAMRNSTQNINIIMNTTLTREKLMGGGWVAVSPRGKLVENGSIFMLDCGSVWLFGVGKHDRSKSAGQESQTPDSIILTLTQTDFW